MDKLDFRFEIKELAADAGTFTGLASAYGKLDLAGDVVEKGAFAATLAARNTVPILYQHNPAEPIGLGKLEDSRDGLLVRGRLSLTANPTAQKAHALLRDGILRGLSIGFDVVRREVKDGVRILKEIRLWEISLVTFPCCPEALVSDVKAAAELEQKMLVAELQSAFHRYRITF